MSFILDALKKSEIERQRQTLPGLAEIPISQRRRFPYWALVLGVLLVINIGVLTGILLRKNPPAAPVVAARHADTEAAAEKTPPAVAEHFSPLSAPVYAPEIPVPADHSPPPAPRDAPRQAAHRADPVLAAVDTDADEVLPSINEVNLTGAQALPELHLDVHVYATSSADRFVYINMRKYHEGNALQEGPIVEHIRRDGVVLNFQGVRFILPRQS